MQDVPKYKYEYYVGLSVQYGTEYEMLVALVLIPDLTFCSPGQMTDLLYTEKDLVTSLKDYITQEENRLEQVKQ